MIICWHSVCAIYVYNLYNLVIFFKHMLKHFLWTSKVAKTAGRVRVILRGIATWWWKACLQLSGCASLTTPTVWMVQEHGNIKYLTLVLKGPTSRIKKALCFNHFISFSTYNHFPHFLHYMFTHEFRLSLWETTEPTKMVRAKEGTVLLIFTGMK